MEQGVPVKAVRGPTDLIASAFLIGLIAGVLLGLLGCTGMRQQKNGLKSVTAESVADQQGVANVATGAVTGLSYQSVLPFGVIVLLTILTLKDAMILLAVVVLSHRREMLRLKRNGEKPTVTRP